MMNKYKIAILALVIVTIFMACDKNDAILLPEDTKYVAFSSGSIDFTENDTTLQIQLYRTAFTYEAMECVISLRTEAKEGEAPINSAEVGTDVNLSGSATISFAQGSVYANATITLIDNYVLNEKKQFYLEITSAATGYQIGIDGKEKVLITIIDNEHPLLYFAGTYAHVGNSIWDGTTNWETSITANPDNLSQILFKPLHPWRQDVQVNIVGTVDETNKTITLASAQRLTDTGDGNYYFRLYSGENFNTNWEGDQTDDPILGIYTINPEKTEIVITLNEWGARWIEPAGTFDGRWWNDYFSTSTLTKN